MRSERIVSPVGLVARWCSLQETILCLRLTKAVSCLLDEESEKNGARLRQQATAGSLRVGLVLAGRIELPASPLRGARSAD